jgi:hypothetical protein
LNTTLTASRVAVVVELRTSLLLPLDDLLVVMREFIYPSMSISALDRCLRRYWVLNLKKLIPEEEKQESSLTTARSSPTVSVRQESGSRPENMSLIRDQKCTALNTT